MSRPEITLSVEKDGLRVGVLLDLTELTLIRDAVDAVNPDDSAGQKAKHNLSRFLGIIERAAYGE